MASRVMETLLPVLSFLSLVIGAADVFLAGLGSDVLRLPGLMLL